jgi:hypothetical protein
MKNEMKRKCILFGLASVMAFGTYAQKNTLLVGGNVGISSSKNENSQFETKNTASTFDPYVGYQFDNHWTAGAVVSVVSNKQTVASSPEQVSKSTNFAAGPFIRYTQKLSDVFLVYGQLQGTFGGYKNTSSLGSVSTTSKGSAFGATLFPAVFINLKNNFGLNFNFGGLAYGSSKPDGGKANSSVSFNFGQVANIGISKNFSFGKK